MSYEEFCQIIAKGAELPTFNQYAEVIEVVYVFSPLNLSKETCARFWECFGINIFEDLYLRSRIIRETCESEYTQTEAKAVENAMCTEGVFRTWAWHELNK